MRRFSIHSLFLVASVFVVGCGSETTPALTSSDTVDAKFAGADKAVAANLAPAAKGAGIDDSAESFDESKTPTESAKIDSMPQAVSASRDQPKLKAGTLTAGSLDDQKNYDDFIEYVRNALQTSNRLPEFAQQLQHERAIIQVQDSTGRPVGDAKVTVFARNEQPRIKSKYQAESENESVISLLTGSDGKTMFLPQLDGSLPKSVTQFDLEITFQDQTISQSVSMNQTPWLVTLDDVVAELPRKLDLALIIDTTGSMGDELAYLKVEIDSIAQKIKSLYPNVDQRFAVILYRDNGDEYVTRAFDFTSSLSEFRATLAKQSARGGGDHPEAMDAALDRATELSWRKGDTARMAFVVGDAPPHDDDYETTFQAINQLRQQDVALYPIAASGSNDKAEFILRMASFMTLGKYLFLTDHSGVGNAHATPDAPKFNVERLDQLMVRTIASELAGEEVLAEDIIATERKNATAPVQTPIETQSQTQPQTNSPDPHYCIPPMPSENTIAAESLLSNCFNINEGQIRIGMVFCCAFALIAMKLFSPNRAT